MKQYICIFILLLSINHLSAKSLDLTKYDYIVLNYKKNNKQLYLKNISNHYKYIRSKYGFFINNNTIFINHNIDFALGDGQILHFKDGKIFNQYNDEILKSHNCKQAIIFANEKHEVRECSYIENGVIKKQDFITY